MIQNSNKIIIAFCFLLLPIILQVSFGEEPPLNVNIATDKRIIFPGDDFQYFLKITNNSNETSNVLIRMNMTGPGSISPNQSIKCSNEKVETTFCEAKMEILPNNTNVTSIAVKVNSDASYDTSFSSNFEVIADLIKSQTSSIISMPSLPNSDQAFLTAGWAGGKNFPPISGQSFSMFILAFNKGPSEAEFVELHYRLSGPGVIFQKDLPKDCFVFEDPKKVMCIVNVLSPENYFVREIPIIANSDFKGIGNFVNEVWVWAGSGNDPIQEYDRDSWDGLTVFTKTPTNPFVVTPKLTLQALEKELALKRAFLDEKKANFNYLKSTSDDDSKITSSQKQYLDAKMAYIEVLKKYLKINPLATDAQLELQKQIAEFTIEYEEFICGQLFGTTCTPEKKLEDFTNVTKPKPVLGNESTNLFELSKIFATDPIKAEIYAQSHGLAYKEGKTKVLLKVDDPNQIPKLANYGATIESSDGNMVQVEISVSDLKNLKNIKNIEKLSAPTIAIQTSNEEISEGVKTVRANLVHEFGLTGKGVKVAVLDLGFDKNNSEIKDNINKTESFRMGFGKPLDLKGVSSEYKHGTAVAEIIVDVAPEVELFLYSIGTETEFAKAIDEAIKDDVDIIQMSMGWINYPTDGTSMITKKTEYAIEKGISFVVSSGNFARNHWEGKFYDSNGNGWHEFSGLDDSSRIDEAITIDVPLSKVKKRPIRVDLLWDDPNEQKDLLGLVLKHKGEQVDYSSHLQPNSKDKKSQSIYFIPQKKGDYELGVYSSLGQSNSKLKIFSSNYPLEHVLSKGSVGVPTDAMGAIVIGAVNHKTLTPEPYSSQGPTNLGTEVPIVVAPSGVSTTAKGNFTGTSASAPHVAGVIALILDKNGPATPSEIKKLLETNAIPLNFTRNIVGYGEVDSGFLVKIPAWFKNDAGLWANNKIKDQKFIQGIEYLIKNDIILIPKTQQDTSNNPKIANWFKTNAGWWSEGKISEDSFIKGIQYLVKHGIILV